MPKGAYGVAHDVASVTLDPADQPSNAAATKGKWKPPFTDPENPLQVREPASDPAAVVSRLVVGHATGQRCPGRLLRDNHDPHARTVAPASNALTCR